MIQPGNGPRLASESLDRVGIIEVSSADRLDGDESAGRSVAREINRGHTALAQLADQLVFALQRAKIGWKVYVGGGHRHENGDSASVMRDTCRIRNHRPAKNAGCYEPAPATVGNCKMPVTRPKRRMADGEYVYR